MTSFTIVLPPKNQLYIIATRLKAVDFATFNVADAIDAITANIMEEIRKANQGASSETIEVLRPEHQLSGAQQLRADDGKEELFKGHAVVGEKAAEGEGKCGQDADPADLPAAHHVAQAEIQPHRHQHGQQGEQELPQGQPEEQAFLIVPDFFVDADFYG